jgi:hypothetical protein
MSTAAAALPPPSGSSFDADDPHVRSFSAADVRVLWAPFPGMQTEFVNAGEFEVFGGGAKGPGKSDCLIAMAARQTDRPTYAGYLIRETGPQLDELKVRTHRLYPQLAGKPHWNGDGHGRWTWPSGARVIFESIATADDVEKIQGKEPSFIGHDEVANCADERVVDLEQAELRSPDPKIIRMWRGTGNPGKKGHAWVKRRFIIPCSERGNRILVRKVRLPNGMEARLTRRFIPGTVLDNPIYALDPLYMAQLATLPEVLRNQLLYGDWNAGYGAALNELEPAVHLVRRFAVPDSWTRFGSFDYGFAHNWVWISFVVNEDGDVFVEDTVRGRRHLPHQIAERVKSRVPVYHPQYLFTHTDSYSFQSKKELNENTPTIAEILSADHQLVLSPGNTDRKAGLQNLRYYLAWRGIHEDGSDGLPALRFMDTPGNRWLFTQLEAMVVDEDDMEDVLKVDSNAETGEGGDDGYDALRVGMASRPPRAIGDFFKGEVSAFSQQALAYMVEHLYRDTSLPVPQGNRFGGDLSTYFTGV